MIQSKGIDWSAAPDDRRIKMTRQQQEVSAAIYCRFSKDDGRATESSSIESQKEMLTRYVRENGWKLYDQYMDDGFSGLNFVDVT